MICYKCGAEAGKEKKCPKCGENLEIFQRVERISNSLYNDGYYKAQVRDLSGAAASLESSLKYNKYNTNARNLLGLVYYEIGETVHALSQWVISVSLQPEKNQASHYLKLMKETYGLMEQMNQTTRKYNQAVYYCSIHNNDLAIIQLKKVIALSPNMLKAHQLLGLLYLDSGDLEKARKALKDAGKIDSANTTTFRYMKEVNRMSRLKSGKTDTKEEELVTYQNGNETVIMPKRFRENSLGTMIRYMIVGVIIGAVAGAVILTPSAVEKVKTQMQNTVASMSSSAYADKQTASDLQTQISAMQGTIDDTAASQTEVEALSSSYQNLLNSYSAYVDKDNTKAVEYLCEVDPSILEGTAVSIFQEVCKAVKDDYMKNLLTLGQQAFSSKNYAQCITYLSALINQDPNYEEGTAAYVLGMAYRQNGDSANANFYFRYIMTNDAGTDLASQAEEMITTETGSGNAAANGSSQNGSTAADGSSQAGSSATDGSSQAGSVSKDTGSGTDTGTGTVSKQPD